MNQNKSHRSVIVQTAIWASLLLTSVGCDTASNDDGQLSGGVLATFNVESEVESEQFKIWITKETTIQQVLNLRDGKSNANIPNGALRRNSGKDNYNAPWSWHVDPEEIAMAEATIEVCDGNPSFIEDDIDYWVDIVGHFCPWGATLSSVEDFR